MSDPERLAEVGRWLRFAREDLATAREDLATARLILGEGGVPRQSCFLSQQAAEKATKAALVFLQTDFPRTHDLDFLRSLLPDGWLLKDSPEDLAELTQWAVEARYPGRRREATEDDARRAIGQAQEVVDAAHTDLQRYGYVPEDTA